MSATHVALTHAAAAESRSSGPQGVRPIHVLTLTPFYPSVEDPAQGCFIAEPLDRTEKLGVTNHVIAVRPFYRPQTRAIAAQFPCVWEPYFSFPGNLGLPTAGKFLAAKLMRTISRLHQKNPFDLIQAHAALPCGQAAATIGEELQIPFIVSVHGLDVFFERQAGRVFGKLCKSASASVYQKASAVICISKKVQVLLGPEMASKCSVIYNGVDPDLFTPAPDAVAPLTVLSVGNLIAIKDHALLLHAFARVSQGRPGSELEIIGDGPERETLVQLAQTLGIRKQVHFLGRQGREAVAQAMRRCTVFALPSRYEALGCVYLEAMASGKPVIACRNQGIEELIENGKNGLLVSPGNESELADALAMLLRNSDACRRLGADARATVIQSLTLEHQAKGLVQAYRACLS